MAALNAGKHVICEKPLEVTPERIAPMIEAAEKNKVTLAAILNRRFNESVVVLKDAVDQKRFGTLSLVEASVKWFRSQEYYDSAGWRGTWALDGGGALMNQSVHIVDQLIHTIGPVKRLTASMACLAHTDIEVEDTAVAILEFENGAKGRTVFNQLTAFQHQLAAGVSLDHKRRGSFDEPCRSRQNFQGMLGIF